MTVSCVICAVPFCPVHSGSLIIVIQSVLAHHSNQYYLLRNASYWYKSSIILLYNYLHLNKCDTLWSRNVKLFSIWHEASASCLATAQRHHRVYVLMIHTTLYQSTMHQLLLSTLHIVIRFTAITPRCRNRTPLPPAKCSILFISRREILDIPLLSCDHVCPHHLHWLDVNVQLLLLSPTSSTVALQGRTYHMTPRQC